MKNSDSPNIELFLSGAVNSFSSLTFCRVYLGGHDTLLNVFLIDFNFYL